MSDGEREGEYNGLPPREPDLDELRNRHDIREDATAAYEHLGEMVADIDDISKPTAIQVMREVHQMLATSLMIQRSIVRHERDGTIEDPLVCPDCGATNPQDGTGFADGMSSIVCGDCNKTLQAGSQVHVPDSKAEVDE